MVERGPSSVGLQQGEDLVLRAAGGIRVVPAVQFLGGGLPVALVLFAQGQHQLLGGLWAWPHSGGPAGCRRWARSSIVGARR